MFINIKTFGLKIITIMFLIIFVLLPSILKTHFQEKSLVPADSSPVILVMLEVMLEMR